MVELANHFEGDMAGKEDVESERLVVASTVVVYGELGHHELNFHHCPSLDLA